MSLKIGENLTKNYSINFDLPKRSKKVIHFIIIHYTGMRRESDAIKRLCDSKSRVSAHYFVKNNGDVLNLVPDLYQAWHAGKSEWGNFKLINKYSIGIEISNPGHKNGYKNFTKKQIKAVKIILKLLIKKYNISYKNVLGHSDISPNRKLDPGEKFPWYELSKKKMCLWHSLNNKKIRKFRDKKISLNEKKIFIQNLYKIGYCKIFGLKDQNNIKKLTIAFQRRFRQEKINGKIDMECLLISKNLLKS